jgi:hypothetical protein
VNGHAWHFKNYDKRPQFAKVRNYGVYFSIFFNCDIHIYILLCKYSVLNFENDKYY